MPGEPEISAASPGSSNKYKCWQDLAATSAASYYVNTPAGLSSNLCRGVRTFQKGGCPLSNLRHRPSVSADRMNRMHHSRRTSKISGTFSRMSPSTKTSSFLAAKQTNHKVEVASGRVQTSRPRPLCLLCPSQRVSNMAVAGRHSFLRRLVNQSSIFIQRRAAACRWHNRKSV